MDDSREIIYLALCNQVETYSEVLEENLLQDKEQRELAEYIIMRSLQEIDKMAEELQNKPISRPSWKK